MKHLLLLPFLLAAPFASAQQLTPADSTAPEPTVLPDTAVPSPQGLFLTLDRFVFSGGTLKSELGGTLGYRFDNGLEVGAGLHRTRSFGITAYTLGATVGYTVDLSVRSGIRTAGRLLADFDNVYAAGVDTPTLSHVSGDQQLRALRADLDVTVFHRLDLTRWMSVTPSAGVFLAGARHANLGTHPFGDRIGAASLTTGLQTGLDLTFRLSDTVSLTLPLRLRLFPQRLVDDRTAPAFDQFPLGTGIRLDF